MRACLPALLIAAAGAAHAQPAEPSDGRDLARGSWPGVSLEDLRGLRECTLEDPPARVGAEVTCRPPVLPSRAHGSLGVGWSTGLVRSRGDVQGAHRLEVDGQYWITRSLGLAGRYAIGAVGTAMDRTAGVTHEVGVGLEWRWFTDEVDRDAFTLSAGAERAFGDPLLRGTLIRGAIARDLGYITREKSAVTWRWELAYAHGLGDAQARVMTAGVRAGLELGIREPRNLHERDGDPPIRTAIAGEARLSPDAGVGASLDVTIARPLMWRTTAFWTSEREDKISHGLDATWAAVTGPRVIFIPRFPISPYLDVQAGPAAIGGSPSARFGVLAEAEGGVTIHIFCQTRLDLGGRLQTEVTDGVDVRSGFFMLRVAHGTALRREASACSASRPIAQR